MTAPHTDQHDRRTLEGIRAETLAIWADAIGDERDVALLDVPNQRNAGDSLILAGELAYLRRLGKRVRYMADLGSYDPTRLRAAMPRGVVLMHGGGNFGDIWFGHQVHRERVAKELRDYRIVALPQSVWFNSAERAAITDQVLAAHPDYRSMIRDTESLARAHELMPNLRFTYSPDAALGFDPPRRRVHEPGARRALILAREDREAHGTLAATPSDWLGDAELRICDWTPLGLDRSRFALLRRLTGLQHQLIESGAWGAFGRALTSPRALRATLTSLNRINVASATRRYRGVSLAVVDRLHAHVLAVLLGVPHVVLDNSYGKIGAVLRDYTGRFSTAHPATDAERARQTAKGLLG